MQDIVHKLVRPFGGAVTVGADGAIAVPKPAALAGPATDQLADAAVFGDAAWRDAARWLLWEIGQVVGVRPASIHDLRRYQTICACSGSRSVSTSQRS